MDIGNPGTMTISEIRAAYVQLAAAEKLLDAEVGKRRLAFMERESDKSTMSDEEAKNHAAKDMASFALPLPDWAKVKLLVRAEMQEKGPKGLIRFYPNVRVIEATETEEYRELFGELPKAKNVYR